MIGIVGGTGPVAGKDLLGKVFNNTLANKDQDHLDVALLSAPSEIEDRTEYLVGEVKVNPGIAIAEVLLKLEKMGATVAGIPCNTAHAEAIFGIVHEHLEKARSKINLLNMIDETVSFIKINYPNITNIGVLSTTGTYKAGIYKNKLEEAGLTVLEPGRTMQTTLIHPAIYHQQYGIKTQTQPIHPQARENLLKGVSYLKKLGAQAVILGCTEIPLAIPAPKIKGIIAIDPTSVLARALITAYNPQKLKPL